MNHWKKMLVFLMLFAVVFTSVPTLASTPSSVRYLSGNHVYKYSGNIYKVYFNNELVNCSIRPAILKNGTYLIPYEYALVGKGPKLLAKYLAQTKCVELKYGTKDVKMYLDKKYMYANDLRKNIKVAPVRVLFMNSSYIALPLSDLCKAFDFNYKIVKKTNSIYVTGKVISPVVNVQASAFKKMSTAQFIAKMGPVAQQDYHNTGILASVTLAQAILESGWGKSGLTQISNNLFGIKASSSGHTWKNSTWNKSSYVTVKTKEEYGGCVVVVTARFRKYASIADSIADHSAYLRYSTNGSRYRYAGIASTKNYMTQLRIIKNGGYATSSDYVSQLSTIIRRYGLTKWDK